MLGWLKQFFAQFTAPRTPAQPAFGDWAFANNTDVACWDGHQWVSIPYKGGRVQMSNGGWCPPDIPAARWLLNHVGKPGDMYYCLDCDWIWYWNEPRGAYVPLAERLFYSTRTQ